MMTSIAIWIYFISVLNNLTVLLGLTGLITFTITIITLVICGIEKVIYPTWFKPMMIYTVVSLGILTLIPTERTMYIIAGLIVGDKVVEIVSESETADKAVQLLNKKLDELLYEPSDKDDGD